MIGDQLQRAIFAALTDAEVASGKIIDDPSSVTATPYVTIGDEQVIDDANSCVAALEAVVDVHVWSRPATGSSMEAKTIGAAVVKALATELPVEGFHTVSGFLETARYLREADGVTVHGVITLRYLLEPMET